MERRLAVLIPLRLARALDLVRLAARFDGVGAAKALPRGIDRPATWRRVIALFEAPAATLEKLPSRSLRAAKLRLFRAFKLLGALKRGAAVDGTAGPSDDAPRRSASGVPPA